MSDYVVGSPSFFNEDSKFFKDVYIYGTLYYDFNKNDPIEFNNLIVREQLEVYGRSTFHDDVYIDTGLSVGILTVRDRLDVGIGGTVLRASSDTGKVGIGSTTPIQKLDVVGNALFTGNVGIGTTTIPEQKLDVGGSVKIDDFIYDSVNSPGINGYYLNVDSSGIRWIDAVPKYTNAIYVQDEGVYIPTAGLAKSFTVLNFKQLNSLGIGTDTLIPIPNPSNPNFIADIQTKDFWGFTNSGNIYRMTNVGIQNSNPTSTLDITGTLHATGAVDFDTTLNVDGDTTLNATLDVDGATTLNSTLDVDGATTLNNTLDVDLATTLNNTLDVDGETTLNNTLDVDLATTLNSTLQVGPNGTVITTTGIGSVGIGTYNPEFDIDLAKSAKFRKAIIDTNNKVGYDTNFYQTPRSVLTQVGVDTTGQIIGGRFFDAANMIRLNLDFIAAEAIGFITSTDYKSPAFVVPGVGGVSTCRNDIKSILKAITLDITKGGNVQSVGAGRSYYNGVSLIHIVGNDVNGNSIKDATIVAITTAAQLARYVINNASLPKSYQSGVSSIRQIKDLTLQDDPIVGVNTNPNGCSNVTSAIYTCANIVTTIINSGPNAVPVNNPDGKVIWSPAGADSRNLIWVSKYGNDDNGGNTEGDAKLTIGAAAAIAKSGDTIMIRPGVYYENNPIGLRTDVGVSGQDLRLVTIVPQNTGKDIFHVRRGCLIENMNFSCDTGQENVGGGALAFPPITADIVAGRSYGAVSGYTAPGPATEGPSGRWRSPYVRNCTNFMPKSIGMKINGDHAVSSTIGADLKCMVCDSFTQYNEAGIGVSITNNGYAQLVSIFTINCDKAVYCDTGGQCDLTNSNSSFGNYGLYAVGLGRTEFTGIVSTTTTAESDIITFKNITDGTQVRRPYDGQALWFKINLSNYNDVVGTGIITAPLQRLKSVTVINGGSQYSVGAPPDITIYDANTNDDNPLGPEGIIAEVSPTISDGGAITAVDLVNSGRNYLSSQDIKVKINGTPTNDLIAVMEPIYYTVESATPVTSVTGITTVTLNEFIPYLVYANDPIEIRRISRILTSGHSFEYIGTGTDINTSTPLKGAVPIKDNEIVALDGAQIPYTSTDQKGNFNIGEGIQVDQTTSTITGRDFSKAIQAQVTPLILALR